MRCLRILAGEHYLHFNDNNNQNDWKEFKEYISLDLIL